MSNCKFQTKLGLNLDELDDYQFDEFLIHREECRVCLQASDDYEKSMLPILRAALPEKLIHYVPNPVPKLADKQLIYELPILDWLKTVLRKSIIEFTLITRKILESARLQTQNLAYIFIWLFLGGCLAYGFSYLLRQSLIENTFQKLNAEAQAEISSLQNKSVVEISIDSSARGKSNEDVLDEKKSKVKPVTLSRNNDEGSHVDISYDTSQSSVNMPSPQQQKDINAVNESDENKLLADSPTNKLPQNNSVDRTPVDLKTAKTTEELQKTVNAGILVTPKKSSPTVEYTNYELINSHPNKENLKDPTFATVQLEAININNGEIDISVCSASEIDRLGNPTSFSMKKPGICQARFKVGFTYDFEIKTPGYEAKLIRVTVSNNQIKRYKVSLRREKNPY